ncbi:MAG TPA: IclR family transcriptional regulator, partial [Stellaceae bacterium]|nr:IclR family transcriptional regulator [Stellaceae bacterium]
MRRSHSGAHAELIEAAADRVDPDAAEAIGEPSPESRVETGALRRAFGLLDALLGAERALTLVEVAEISGLNTSTAHRLLQSFIQLGHVHRDATKRYLPSLQSLLPLGQYHPIAAFRRSALLVLRDLRDRTGLTVALLVFQGFDRYILEMVPGTDPFSPYYNTRATTPLHGSTSGKLLLAHLDPKERDRLLGPEPYVKHASRSLTTRAALFADLDLTAERNYALTCDEVFDGMSAVASPILLPGRRMLGVIVLSGPNAQLTGERIPALAHEARVAAELFAHASPDARALAACRIHVTGIEGRRTGRLLTPAAGGAAGGSCRPVRSAATRRRRWPG